MRGWFAPQQVSDMASSFVFGLAEIVGKAVVGVVAEAVVEAVAEAVEMLVAEIRADAWLPCLAAPLPPSRMSSRMSLSSALWSSLWSASP